MKVEEKAVSKAQQALFGIALSVKRGDKKLEDVPSEHQEKVKGIVDSMDEKEIEKFAKTKTEDLSDKVEEALKNGRMPTLQDVYEDGEATLDSAVGRGEFSLGNDTSDKSDNTKGSGEKFGDLKKKKIGEEQVELSEYKDKIKELLGEKYDENDTDQCDIITDCFTAGTTPDECIKKL